MILQNQNSLSLLTLQLKGVGSPDFLIWINTSGNYRDQNDSLKLIFLILTKKFTKASKLSWKQINMRSSQTFLKKTYLILRSSFWLVANLENIKINQTKAPIILICCIALEKSFNLKCFIFSPIPRENKQNGKKWKMRHKKINKIKI